MRKLMKGLIVMAVLAALLSWAGPGSFPQQSTQETDGSKYGKYIISNAILRNIKDYTGMSLLSQKGELETDLSMGYHCVTKPILFGDTHSHPHAELLCFIGGNPVDITDLGAEIEMSLGSEHEKHIITKTSCVSIPSNLPHCPLNIKKVDKPIVFLMVSLARQYKTEKPAAKE
jgi:hypothetical protein